MIVHESRGAWRRGLIVLLVAVAASAIFTSAAAAAGLEFTNFEGRGVNSDRSPSTIAGAHPAGVVNDFQVNLESSPDGAVFPTANVKDIDVELPPGFVGNVAAFPRCTQEELGGELSECSIESQIGVATLRLKWATFPGEQIRRVGVFNMVPPRGVAAEFGFRTTVAITYVDFHVRSGSDYGVTATIRNINEGAPVIASNLEIWGVPGDPSHDEMRIPRPGATPAKEEGPPSASPPVPYPLAPPYIGLLSNPTSCGAPLVTTMSATSWQERNQRVELPDDAAPAMTGCGDLSFDPTVHADPTTSQGDSPSGLDFRLHIPQSQAAEGKATAHLRDSTVSLPASLTVNPASANGLAACDVQQIGFLGSNSEKQSISYLPGAAKSLTFSFKGASTAPLPGTANRAQITATLETLPGLAGNISLRGAPGGWVVTFGGALAGTDVPELSGTIAENPSQTVEVTGTGGGFNFGFEGVSSGPVFPASFTEGSTFVFAPNPGIWTISGQWLEGPGIAAGTELASSGTLAGFSFFELSKPTMAEEAGAELRTAVAFDASAAKLNFALEEIPALKGNVAVAKTGTVGTTRTYRVYFTGALADSEPALLTATSSLVGGGAGVTVSPAAMGTAPISIGTTQEAGAPEFTPDAAECPPASEIGTVKIDSPAVIDHTLEGSVFLAKPHENPYDSLLAMYITVNDPRSGVVVKLPGLIEADPQTGQLTATVADAPQLPFEDLELSFFKGDAAPLKTGVVCGTYETKTDLVPWSAPEGQAKHPNSSFSIDHGCAESEGKAPKTMSFDAGTVDPAAGKSSPFVLKLSRPDGSQQLTGIDTTLPKGLLAKLAGVPYCSDQALAAAGGKSGKDEQANPSCPAASQVGTVTVGAGAGGHPFYAPGKAYLAGPYKGAPLSLAVITPAVAGPFDLGTVVVRNALYVDPTTAQVHAVSDPFPHILQGIPLDIRSIALTLDRSEFTRNPTNCDPFAITGAAATLAGQSADLSQPFQAQGCESLGFSPKLNLRFKGQTKRTGNPAVRAVLTPRPGQANIANTTVILPKTVFIDQSHVNNPCTRVQFNEDACPAKSVLGHATAWSPLLEQPLSGPVYFRSNGGERQLPDIVADLHGQINVVLVGYIDSIKVSKETSRVRTRFATVPDAPVSRFVLNLKGGKRGLIENSKSLCKVKPVANILMTGQNGKTHDFAKKIKTSCGSHKKSKAKRNGHKQHKRNKGTGGAK
jgi:hypothetical protein